jgi:sigma-54 dependent transcriptional regulator, acetoin dehydrogenase operon transcriptional activator AcoR
LFEVFTALRRSDRPALLVSPALCIADPVVADLIGDLPTEQMWDRVRSAKRPGSQSIDLELADGTVVPALITPLPAGSHEQGLLVEVLSDARPMRGPARRDSASGRANTPPKAAVALARAGSPLLLTGERGSGKTWAARQAFRTEGHNLRLVAIDMLAADDAWPEKWVADVRAAAAGTDVLLLRHLDRIGPRCAAALLPSLDQWASAPGGPALAATALAAPRPGSTDLHPTVTDLLDRFAAVEMAPLRKRRGDVRMLVAAITREHGNQIRWSQEALDVLEHRSWPGNVRELAVVVARTLSTRSTGLIRAADLPLDIRQEARRDRLTTMERAERDAIMEALEVSGGNKVMAAAELGISRSSLYRKIRHFGLEPGRSRR